MADVFDPDVELVDLRAEVLEFMPDTATVVRASLAPDGYGGQTALDTTVAVAPCAWKVLAGQELATAAKVAPYATVGVDVPYGTDVTVSDALLVNGTRHEVQHIVTGTYAVKLRCLCSVVS